MSVGSPGVEPVRTVLLLLARVSPFIFCTKPNRLRQFEPRTPATPVPRSSLYCCTHSHTLAHSECAQLSPWLSVSRSRSTMYSLVDRTHRPASAVASHTPALHKVPSLSPRRFSPHAFRLSHLGASYRSAPLRPTTSVRTVITGSTHTTYTPSTTPIITIPHFPLHCMHFGKSMFE